MSSLSTALEPAMSDVVSTRVDSEAAAGGEETRPRVARPLFVYRGTGESHWHGQPCHVTDAQNVTAAGVPVVFACGCRALVAPGCLERTL